MLYLIFFFFAFSLKRLKIINLLNYTSGHLGLISSVDGHELFIPGKKNKSSVDGHEILNDTVAKKKSCWI